MRGYFRHMMAATPEGFERSIARCVLLLIGYLVLTTFFVFALEPGFTPPGFTGRGAWAMPLVLLGAFHAAKWYRAGVLFLVFGCLGALPLLLSYFSDHRLMFGLNSQTTIYGAVAAWVAFITGMGLSARLAAGIGWRRKKHNPADPPRCRICGYDLRASTGRCPECGTAIEPVKACHTATDAQRVAVLLAIYGSVLLLLRPRPDPSSAAAAPAPTTQWLLILRDFPQGAQPTFSCLSANQTPTAPDLLLPTDDRAASGE
jgi:hypothetical protein